MAKGSKYSTDDDSKLTRTGAKAQLAHGQKPRVAGTDQSSAKNADSGTENYFKKVKDTGYAADEDDIAQGFTRIPV
jgi:hypothetical protein